MFRQHLGDRAAQPAVHVVLFGRDDGSGFLGAGEEQIDVDRLDRVDIDDARTDALRRQFFGRIQRLDDHVAGRHDRQIAAFAHHHAFADLKIVGRFVEHHRHFGAAQTQVERPLEPGGGARRQFRLDRVGDRDDGHVRQGAHEGEVGNRVVARPVVGVGQSGIGAGQLDVEAGVGDQTTHRIGRPQHHEGGEGVGEGNLAGRRQPRRHCHHVGFGDADVEIAFREGLAEDDALARTADVGIERDDVGIFLAELGERFAVNVADGSFHCAHGVTSSSFMAFTYSSSEIGLPCQALLPSMNETPLPLTVSAMMTVGLPLIACA